MYEFERVSVSVAIAACIGTDGHANRKQTSDLLFYFCFNLKKKFIIMYIMTSTSIHIKILTQNYDYKMLYL